MARPEGDVEMKGSDDEDDDKQNDDEMKQEYEIKWGFEKEKATTTTMAKS